MADTLNTLTVSEKAVLKAIAFNDYGDGDWSAPIWSNAINDSRYDSGIKGKTLSGVVSSLAKKGLVECSHMGNDATVAFSNETIYVLARAL